MAPFTKKRKMDEEMAMKLGRGKRKKRKTMYYQPAGRGRKHTPAAFLSKDALRLRAHDILKKSRKENIIDVLELALHIITRDTIWADDHELLNNDIQDDIRQRAQEILELSENNITMLEMAHKLVIKNKKKELRQRLSNREPGEYVNREILYIKEENLDDDDDDSDKEDSCKHEDYQGKQESLGADLLVETELKIEPEVTEHIKIEYRDDNNSDHPREINNSQGSHKVPLIAINCVPKTEPENTEQ